MYHQLKKFAWKDDKRREGRIHDKEEKAVAEQAVDPQTKILLFKMINNGILENVNGVISTGKEAVILHAEGGPGPDPGVTTIELFIAFMLEGTVEESKRLIGTLFNL